MIKLNISNLIPVRLAIYLLGIIPGMLFHLSVAFGSPNLAHQMIDRAKQVYPFQPYSLFVLFVLLCLLTGQTFFLLSEFAAIFLAMLPQLRPSWQVFEATGNKGDSELAMILRCWGEAATQLLKQRYGIDKSGSDRLLMDHDGRVWYALLGKQPAMLKEAAMTMRTTFGCGLAGLSALYVSPGLRNRYFITIAVMFMVSGCYQLFDLAKWQQNQIRDGLIRLSSVLTQLAETNTSTKKDADHSEKGCEFTAESDSKKDS